MDSDRFSTTDSVSCALRGAVVQCTTCACSCSDSSWATTSDVTLGLCGDSKQQVTRVSAVSRLGHVAGCQALGEEELDGDSFLNDGGGSSLSARVRDDTTVGESSTVTTTSHRTASFLICCQAEGSSHHQCARLGASGFLFLDHGCCHPRLLQFLDARRSQILHEGVFARLEG